MPKISDLMNQVEKKFKKSNYRPWNYMDEIAEELKKEDILTDAKESKRNHKVITDEVSLIDQSQTDLLDIKLGINTSSAALEIDLQNEQKEVTLKEIVINQNKKSRKTEQKTDQSELDMIFRLTGHQKAIFFFIVEKCMSRGLLSTGIIKGEVLVELTNATHKMVKTSLKRLTEKNLVSRSEGKRGRGGFTMFDITESVRNSMLEYKRITGAESPKEIIKESIGNHAVSMVHSENVFSDYDNGLPDLWKIIDYESLSNIGFSETHLLQLFKKKLNPEMIQDSINHFALGLSHHKEKYSKYKDPLNVFIGVLRKGESWFEPDYVSPEEKAQADLLKRKAEEQGRLKKMQEEALNLAYEAWRQNLSEKEIKELIPPNKEQASIPQRVRLSMYFEVHVWPEIKHQYLITA